jgi:ABC-2 type transport system permease protein
MSATAIAPPRQRGRASAALLAVLAIFERDLLVTRREAATLLVQTLVQPLFLLFVFGKVLTGIGAARPGFAAILLPGVVALTVFITPLQAISIDLGRDLGFTREIEDRLLAPLPGALVALQKVVFAALRGLFAGALVFPMAWLVLGSGYQVRTDLLGLLVALMVLTALLGAALGLLLGVVVPITMLSLIFSLVITPLIFTGCTYYPWASLSGLRWFQVLTLFNPLTYASEGLRHAMIPPAAGVPADTLGLGWVVLVLGASAAAALIAGMRFFRQRTVS